MFALREKLKTQGRQISSQISIIESIEGNDQNRNLNDSVSSDNTCQYDYNLDTTRSDEAEFKHVKLMSYLNDNPDYKSTIGFELI